MLHKETMHRMIRTTCYTKEFRVYEHSTEHVSKRLRFGRVGWCMNRCLLNRERVNVYE